MNCKRLPCHAMNYDDNSRYIMLQQISPASSPGSAWRLLPDGAGRAGRVLALGQTRRPTNWPRSRSVCGGPPPRGPVLGRLKLRAVSGEAGAGRVYPETRRCRPARRLARARALQPLAQLGEGQADCQPRSSPLQAATPAADCCPADGWRNGTWFSRPRPRVAGGERRRERCPAASSACQLAMESRSCDAVGDRDRRRARGDAPTGTALRCRLAAVCPRADSRRLPGGLELTWWS